MTRWQLDPALSQWHYLWPGAVPDAQVLGLRTMFKLHVFCDPETVELLRTIDIYRGREAAARVRAMYPLPLVADPKRPALRDGQVEYDGVLWEERRAETQEYEAAHPWELRDRRNDRGGMR